MSKIEFRKLKNYSLMRRRERTGLLEVPQRDRKIISSLFAINNKVVRAVSRNQAYYFYINNIYDSVRGLGVITKTKEKI